MAPHDHGQGIRGGRAASPGARLAKLEYGDSAPRFSDYSLKIMKKQLIRRII
jgi:hypothetical protein